MERLTKIKIKQCKRSRLRQYRNCYDSISRRGYQIICRVADLANKNNNNTLRRNSYNVGLSVTLKDLYYTSRKYLYANK